MEKSEKVLFGDTDICLSLTGKDSHKFRAMAGFGSFSIGTKDVSEGKYDVWVNREDTIDWSCFNGYYTYGGWQQKHLYPYGNWPRFLIYSGDDLGFIKWSYQREIEEFNWTFQKNLKVDLIDARIRFLHLYLSNYRIELSLGKQLYQLCLFGNLENCLIEKCIGNPTLWLKPKYDSNIPLYRLPTFEKLNHITELYVFVSPFDPPVDCVSLLQFPKLKQLYLTGAFTNLDALTQLKDIEKLGIWDAPDLSGMPSLESFDKLINFVAVNIDEKAGKVFQKELAILKKKRKFENTAVCKLRSPLWFKTNYDIPFSNWEVSNEKKAVRAYKKCLEKVKNASNENDIRDAIVDFVQKINQLEDIESSERDDVYLALCTIMKNSLVPIDEEKWMTWFDEIRYF